MMNTLHRIYKILIVDDKNENLFTLEQLLKQIPYVQIVAANTGNQALSLTLENDFCLAIVDVQMPEMDGYELVELLRGNTQTAHLPVIFVSAIFSDEYHHRKGYGVGAVDFMSKPFIPEILLSKVRVFIQLQEQRLQLEDVNKTLEYLVSKRTEELRQAYDSTLEGWAQTLEMREGETAGHSRRVVALTMQIAKILGIPEEEQIHIHRGALLHDIGKIAIPDDILLKKGPLTDEERNIMRLHPAKAYDLLSRINYLIPALDIPYYHHERWDGYGYPHGIAGQQIPLAARIFAVVDVWDALLSNRPYRPPMLRSEVIEYIQNQAGKHFDPFIVEIFVKCVQ